MVMIEALLDSSGFQTVSSDGIMRISATIFVILISTYIVNASVLDPVIENVVHLKASKPPSGVPGIWKKKTIWKPRWVKEWKSAKVMKPIWRKVWSPVQIREWVPIPKPPPGWDAISTPLAPVHPKPQTSPLKDLQGHDSFPAHASTKVPLWDPVPYPESQQPPPPPPFPQPLHNPDVSCGKGGCDNSPSQTFNHQQISEIIGTRYQTPDYFQNPDYSETVNHLTRLPPDGNNWRPPQPQGIQFDNVFNSFPRLAEFLIPPKTQQQPENVQFQNSKAPSVNAAGPPPGFEIQNSLRWTPLPPENKFKNHLITKGQDQQYKFELPEIQLRNPNNTTVGRQNLDTGLKENPNYKPQNISSGLRPQADGDFIQEAQLVGEYHYSEFDLPNFKPVPNKPQPNLQEDQAKVKPLQKVKTEQQEGLQKPTANQKTAVDNKPTQTRTQIKQPEGLNAQTGSQIQKKHIPNPSSNSNFQQQQAAIKEIFPIFRAPQTSNHNSPSVQTNHKNQEKPQLMNHSSTKLVAVAATQPNSTKTDFNSPQEKKIYPIYERPQRINTNIFPPNHRFSFNSNDKEDKPFSSNNSTRLATLPPPKPTKPENPTFDKTNSIQLVFATTPVDHNLSTEDFKKPKTTESYEVIFSSSLMSTTEAVTKSPVIIVTPINSKS